MHIRAGFRAVRRQPAVVLGEIAWRWAFGAAAWTLVIIALHRILAHVDVTQAELLIARGSDVFLIADAGARILVQVLPQLARESLVLAPAIAILWMAAATVGRAMTLRALFPDRGRDAQLNDLHIGPLLVLNLLRTLFTFTTLIAYFGALLLAGVAMRQQNPAFGALAGIMIAAVVGILWSLVNWFLGLAPIWIVRDGSPALRSIADSVQLYQRGRSPYVGIASAFGVLRAAALIVAFVAALIAAQARPAAAVALCVVISLIYFAVADLLYVARLAAYIALEESSHLSVTGAQPITPEPLISTPTSTANANGGC